MKCFCEAKLRKSTEVGNYIHPIVDDECNPLPHCALGGMIACLDWWRRLARQVAKLTKDKRKPEECARRSYCHNLKQPFITEELDIVGCCPCAAWKGKGKGKSK